MSHYAMAKPYSVHRRVRIMVAATATTLVAAGLGGCGLVESDPEPSDGQSVLLFFQEGKAWFADIEVQQLGEP